MARHKPLERFMPMERFMPLVRQMPLAFKIGFVMTVFVVIMAAVSLIWTPYAVDQLDITARLKSPFDSAHLLGTDHFGRDMLSMVMVGAQISIMVALIAVGIGMVVGVPLGLTAAAFQGSWLDHIIMRGNDLAFAFPALVIAILITAILGPSAVNAILAIGIFNIPVFARITRAAAMTQWQLDYILAARVAGKSKTRISWEHILPNISNLLIVQASIQFSLGILAEAGLSYVGLGAQPPVPSWGRMLAESQTMISFAPHLAVIPGLAIIITVLGLNLMGDGLRDWLDPRLRHAHFRQAHSRQAHFRHEERSPK